jgi:hypothetical protein
MSKQKKPSAEAAVRDICPAQDSAPASWLGIALGEPSGKLVPSCQDCVVQSNPAWLEWRSAQSTRFEPSRAPTWRSWIRIRNPSFPRLSSHQGHSRPVVGPAKVTSSRGIARGREVRTGNPA